MKELLYYLLQVIIASGILYGYYHVALRNKRFHRYNRYYLLAATVISIIIPFFNIPVYFSQQEKDSFVLQTLTVFSLHDSNTVIASTTSSHTSFFTWQNIAYSFYILIASIVLLRIVFSLYKIKRTIKNNTVEKLDDINFVNTNEPGTPFSFFRWLFWNNKIELHSEKGEQIFRHELFHIKQKHSWDIIYMELLTIPYWINPFFHLIKKEVKAIHEFLADQFAVTENKKWDYAEMLLMQALSTHQRLVNPFFHNQIKRRIAMITTSKKPGPQYLRKIMVLPVTLIVIFLCAFTYKERQQANNKLSLENISSFTDTTVDPTTSIKEIRADGPVYLNATNFIVNGNPSESKGLGDCIYIINGKEIPKNEIFNKMIEAQNVIAYQPNDKTAIELYGPRAKDGVLVFEKATITNAKLDTVSPRVSDQMIFDKVEIEPAFPGGSDKWRQYLQRNLDASVGARKKAPWGTYTVAIQFIVNTEGIISDIKPLTQHGYGMEDEAIRVIKKGPRWNPAMQNGKRVNAYNRVVITFVVDKGDKVVNDQATVNGVKEVVVTGYPTTNSSFKSFDEFTRDKSFDNHLLIIDKKVMGKFGDNTKNMELNSFKSFTLLDANAAMKKYGTAGKFGAIEAFTKINAPGYDNNVKEVPGYSIASKVFTKAETPPSFPGGDSAWKKYLTRNINAAKPVDNGAPEGTYKVIIQFIVHEDGSVTDINALTDHGFGMEEEAMRIIRVGPKWIPAKQNGNIVTAYVQQPVTFVIEGEDGPSITGVNPKAPANLALMPAISLSELKNASIYKLLLLPEGTKIVGYMFTIDPNGVVKESPDNGSKFNNTTRDLIRSAKVGNTVTFDHIKIMENGAEKRIPARVYKVTN